MRIFYAAVVFSFLSLTTFSQTNVSGTLTTDTEWTLAGSPYNLTGITGIVPGVTLTIHPGVKVNGGDFDLVIRGKAVINGTASQPVEFTNLPLVFRNTDLSLSTIRHVKFDKSGVVLASGPYEDPSEIQNTLIVKNCSFDNRAFVYGNGKGSNASVTLEDCLIQMSDIGNSWHETFHPIDLVRVKVTSSAFCRIIRTISQSELGNSNLNFLNGDLTIENSDLTNCSIPFQGGPQSLTLTRSRFNNVFLNGMSSVIHIDGCNFNAPTLAVAHMLSMKSGSIKNSTFEGHLSLGGIRIYENTVIENVSFKAFSVALEVTSDAAVRVNHSNFINNTSNIKNLRNISVNARDNYWGTADESVIKTKITDYYDNLNYGIVDYGDFSSTPLIINFLPAPSAVYKGIHANGTLLHWKKALDSNVVGYKIYRKTGATYTFVADASNNNSYVVQQDPALDFVVTSYNVMADGINDSSEGNESEFSVISIPFITVVDGQAAACGGTDLSVNFTDQYGLDGNSNLHLITSLSPDFSNSTTAATIGATSADKFVWTLPSTPNGNRVFYYRIASEQFDIFSETKSIKVLAGLTTDFTVEPDCTPGGYKITATGIEQGVTATWNVGDGAISQSSPNSWSAKWNTNGEKAITLTAALGGCETTVSKVVAVTVDAAFAEPAICSVEYDEASGKNIVSWNYEHPKFHEMKIYREEGRAEFKLIATVSAGASSYTDNSANAQQRAYQYRLAAVNKCGVETAMSEPVTSFHLRLGEGTNGDWNLAWEERYEPGKIEIYRKSDLTWNKIGDLSTIHTSFTDVTAEYTTNFYQAKISRGGSCVIASNIVFNGITATEVNALNLRVHPNPTSDKLAFYHPTAGQYEVVDPKGVATLRGIVDAGDNNVSIGTLPRGIYLLKIQSGNKLSVTRVFKK